MSTGDMLKNLQRYKNSSPKTLISIINYAHRVLNSENCLIIYAFLLNLQRQKPKIDPIYIRSINICINFLKAKLKFINKTLIVKDIEFQSTKKSKSEVYNIYNEITSLVLQTLIKSSFKELENIICSFFGERKLRKIEMIDEFVFKIEKLKFVEDKVKGYYLLSRFIECIRVEESVDERDECIKKQKIYENETQMCNGEEEWFIKRVIDCFCKFKVNATHFLYILYLTNLTLYKSIENFIFSEPKIRLEIVKCFPLLNLEGRELNENIIEFLIENKPVHRQTVVDYLLTRRDMLFSVLKDHYSFFSVVDLNLSFEEHLSLCETINENIFFLFEYLKFFVEDDESVISKFVKMLISKDETFLKVFFETFYTSRSEIYESCVLSFLRQKRIGEELYSFFVEYFIEKIKIKEDKTTSNDEFEGFSFAFARDVFFALIYYLKKAVLITHMEVYLTDESNLREFLKVLTPNEIYLNVHYFKDIQNSISISQIISTKSEVFNEQVVIYVITKMEESALPPLFMRTVIVSVTKFPSLKKFIVDLMFRLVRLEIWKMPRLYDGFVRCLMILGNSAVEIIMSMPEDRIREILGSNDKMLSSCENHIKTHSGLKGKYAFVFKNVVYGLVKKKDVEKKDVII